MRKSHSEHLAFISARWLFSTWLLLRIESFIFKFKKLIFGIISHLFSYIFSGFQLEFHNPFLLKNSDSIFSFANPCWTFTFCAISLVSAILVSTFTSTPTKTGTLSPFCPAASSPTSVPYIWARWSCRININNMKKVLSYLRALYEWMLFWSLVCIKFYFF